MLAHVRWGWTCVFVVSLAFLVTPLAAQKDKKKDKDKTSTETKDKAKDKTSTETKEKVKDKASSGPIDPNGRWQLYKPGLSKRFVVWHIKDGEWRVATTTAKALHAFRGNITIDGGTFETFSKFKTVDQTKGDFGVLNATRTSLLFQFTTLADQDGFNFTVSPGAKAIQFVLQIDTKDVPQDIYIGVNGAHPASSTFTFPARP